MYLERREKKFIVLTVAVNKHSISITIVGKFYQLEKSSVKVHVVQVACSPMSPAMLALNALPPTIWWTYRVISQRISSTIDGYYSHERKECFQIQRADRGVGYSKLSIRIEARPGRVQSKQEQKRSKQISSWRIDTQQSLWTLVLNLSIETTQRFILLQQLLWVAEMLTAGQDVRYCTITCLSKFGYNQLSPPSWVSRITPTNSQARMRERGS